MKNLLALFSVAFILAACADRKADFEEADYLIGRGGAAAGLKAQNLVQAYLDSPDLNVKIEAHRLFAGAKVAQTGLKPSRIISRIVEKADGEGTISVLKDAFIGVQEGPTARTRLQEAIDQLAVLAADANFAAISTTSTPELQREKRGLYYMSGMAHLLYALILGTVDSQLLTADNFAAVCDQNLTEQDLNDFVDRLRDARIAFINAGLNDIEQKQQILTDSNLVDEGIDTQLNSFTTADSRNNSLNDFVDNIQETVDGDFTGTPGTGGGYTVAQFCVYLQSQGD